MDTWGVRSVDGGCVLDSWLVPTGCVLPPPPSIWPPLLGRWERQSEPLAVNKNARQAISDFLPYFEQVGGVNPMPHAVVSAGVRIRMPACLVCGCLQCWCLVASQSCPTRLLPRWATACPFSLTLLCRRLMQWRTLTCSRKWT